MTNLTEQWKKGELSSGWYYVRLIRGEHRIDLYINGKNEWVDCPDNIIDAVVCDVPTYEEWEKAYECQLMESELVLTLKDLLKRAKDILEDEGDYMIVQQIDEVLK